MLPANLDEAALELIRRIDPGDGRALRTELRW
jgi:hypothetical protein